jgi:acyl-coenzyme A synthetase/AMP-(fatty) acid ligase
VDYKQPVEIVALTSIPKTPANKIDRRALRVLWNERLTLRRSADSPSSA